MIDNLYEVLGVKKEATLDDIKKSFKKKAQKLHPDKNKGKGNEDCEGTEEQFKELQKAYHILKDPTRRSAYDKTGKTEQPKSVEQEAWQCICELYTAILDRNSFVPFDFVKDISRSIEASKLRANETLSSRESDCKKIQNLIDNTEGSEHLLNILDQKMKQVLNDKGHCEKNIEILDMAKTLIEGCKYTGVIPDATYNRHSGTSFSFNTTL
jgi:DnaJ-class molecular chaperone